MRKVRRNRNQVAVLGKLLPLRKKTVISSNSMLPQRVLGRSLQFVWTSHDLSFHRSLRSLPGRPLTRQEVQSHRHRVGSGRHGASGATSARSGGVPT